MAEKDGGKPATNQGNSDASRPQSYATGTVQKGENGGGENRPRPYGTGKVQEGETRG